ncbi:hypothetical protein IN840_25370 (plasmid) [Mycobacteroides abscessus subsp. abscessus]|uniref:TIGR02391 family protein n=1 Tax=Mycobacteroides abscessus TaxID=36809 RepID=UPI0019D21F88|nr:hypothetical protein IN840_25370 [Mycobacteroides abscessus subsp. abscessus]
MDTVDVHHGRLQCLYQLFPRHDPRGPGIARRSSGRDRAPRRGGAGRRRGGDRPRTLGTRRPGSTQPGLGEAAREAVIFTEDRIRRWAGRPVTEVGKDLAVAIFGNNGEFRMGLADGEKQGWQLLAQGIAQAIRNADAHRIQNRSDHRRYAMGVIGSCSRLLTQMRFEHGNRFHDASPIPPTSEIE